MKLIDLVRKVIKEEQRKLKEGTATSEVDDLAIDLLDYMGGSIESLPNWNLDKRIVKYFQENGIDRNLAQTVYQAALKLSRSNRH